MYLCKIRKRKEGSYASLNSVFFCLFLNMLMLVFTRSVIFRGQFKTCLPRSIFSFSSLSCLIYYTSQLYSNQEVFLLTLNTVFMTTTIFLVSLCIERNISSKNNIIINNYCFEILLISNYPTIALRLAEVPAGECWLKQNTIGFNFRSYL